MEPKQSDKCEHVLWYPDGYLVEDYIIEAGWYWYDECGLLGSPSPKATEQDAIDELGKYARDFLSSL